MEKAIYHRHIGVYGVCVHEGRLLVIHKRGGPYSGRFDLPGGSMEPDETILDTVSREFREETGLQVRVLGNLGTKDFVVPWRREGFEHTHCHHIAILYEVEAVSGDIRESPNLYDSRGAEWAAPGRLQADSCSPLVTEALYWLANRRLSEGTTFYDEWEIYDI